MRKTITQKALAIIAGAILMMAMSTTAFAGTTITDGKGTVPVYLTQTATPVDVTIGTGEEPDPDPQDPNNPVPIDTDGDGTNDDYGPNADAIYMKAGADTNTASVTKLKVKNNNVGAPVFVKGILVNNVASGYTLDAYNDDYKTKQADSHAFGLALTGATGLTPASTIEETDLKTGYTSTGDSIAANSTGTYNLAGKVAAVTTAVGKWTKVADCVVTVAMKP